MQKHDIPGLIWRFGAVSLRSGLPAFAVEGKKPEWNLQPLLPLLGLLTPLRVLQVHQGSSPQLSSHPTHASGDINSTCFPCILWGGRFPFTLGVPLLGTKGLSLVLGS